jgi:flagellar motor switch protein FliM
MVKPYDFRKPDKFSKDQLRTMQILHEGFARRASSVLSAYLRTVVQVSFISIEQETFGEFVQRLPNPAVLHVLDLAPLPGRAIMETSPDVAFAMIDRLLGGFGRSLAQARELTDVEMSLLETVVAHDLNCLRDAWLNVAKLNPRVVDVASSAQFLQVAVSTDVTITILFEVKIVDCAGSLRICIPYTTLEPITSQLNAQVWFAASRREVPEAQAEALRRHMNKVRVPLSVNLGNTDISVSELMNLQKGDVICLEKGTKEDLEVMVGRERRFSARPGVLGKRMAARITAKVKEESLDE